MHTLYNQLEKFMTIKELKSVLEKYDETLPLVIYHSGKGHEYEILEEDIRKIEDAYFPYRTKVKYPEGTEFLRIGVI